MLDTLLFKFLTSWHDFFAKLCLSLKALKNFCTQAALFWYLKCCWNWPRDQFHQHFWCQSRATFAHMTFDTFYCNSIWQNCTKNIVLGTKAVLKYAEKFKDKLCWNRAALFAPSALTLAQLVEEKDFRCQFHHYYMSSFCAKILLPKKYKPKL